MPEINFRIKVKGGKRTETQVGVEPYGDANKIITFKNGVTVDGNELAKEIWMSVYNYINRVPLFSE